MAGISISLAAEPIYEIGHFPITNSMLTAVILTLGLLGLALIVRLGLSLRPTKTQTFFEFIYQFLIDTGTKVTGNAAVTKDLFPFVTTAFLFIVLSNWSGLLPIMGSVGLHEVHHGQEVLVPLFRAPTSDLNVVLALALLSVGYVQYLGVKYRGGKSYLHTFFNFSGPIDFFIGIIELISEFTRIISYTFRLFGNVFAGEVLIAVILFLTSTLAPILPILPLPFYILELFVGLVQGLVFCFLTIVFAGIATADHSGGHDPAPAKANG